MKRTMKKICILLLAGSTIYLTSCSNSPSDKAQDSVKSYLKKNLKLPDKYEPLSFSKLDTLAIPDTSNSKLISLYQIKHIYAITNSENVNTKMTVTFNLDRDLKVNEPTKNIINGDFGILTGNAYWKYNNYIGNKADAGAEITLYALDTVRGNLKYESIADVQGNYRIEKVLPGLYFLIVRAKNATDCPEAHLENLRIYSDDIKQIFGLDVNTYSVQLDEIKNLNDSYINIITDIDEEKYGGLSAKIDKYTAIEKEMRDKAAKLLESFPEEFKQKIKLYTGYSNAYDFNIISIEEGKTLNIVSDFGITCL